MDLVDIYSFGNRLFVNFMSFFDWLRTPIGDVPSFAAFWNVLNLGIKNDGAFLSLSIMEVLFGSGLIAVCVLILVRFVVHILK